MEIDVFSGPDSAAKGAAHLAGREAAEQSGVRERLERHHAVQS